MAYALTGARIFDGHEFLAEHALIVAAPRILGIMPEADLEPGLERRPLAGGWLAPGFIDVQVNGGGGALFNATPDTATVAAIQAAHRRFGTTGLLPTVITDAPEVLARALAAVREARAAGVPGILGIHVEGPFLDPRRKGAHAAAHIRAITAADIELLAGAECGVVMLTLAPNCVPPAMVRSLVERGIRVSLGHAEASFAEAAAAIAAGASAFTHLFNAMSQLGSRDPGMVGAALANPHCFAGIIADGHHVHDASLAIALASKPHDRLMLITDAMPPAAGGPDHYELQGRLVERQDGALRLEDGTLAGSALTMDAAVRYCVERLGLGLADALRMASEVPAAFLGLSGSLGRLAPGYLASMVHLDEDLAVRQTWINGI
jgi:N-acetylglucosamine-6-phosphate deacetylase